MVEKIKKISMKSAMRAFAILWMFVLIVMMTIANVVLDETFNWIKWLGNTLILFGITAFGLLIGESTGIDHQKEKVDGLYQRELKTYEIKRSDIDPIVVYFPLFYDWYIPTRIEAKHIEFLMLGGMHTDKARAIVRYCTIEDFADLQAHAIEKVVNGKTIHIKKLLDKEVEPVKLVLSGGVAFKQSGTAYYLQAHAESNQADIMEVGEYIKEERAKNRRTNRIVRITSGVVISLGLGILTVGDMSKGNNVQAWFNLITRIANLITALLSGYLSGVFDVKKQAEAIANKTAILKIFESSYQKHLFEIFDEEEAAKREYEEYKKEVEETKENIVDPEIEPENENIRMIGCDDSLIE